jgi:hypothetical protein
MFEPLGREHENDTFSRPIRGKTVRETPKFFSVHTGFQPFLELERTVGNQTEPMGM